MSTHINRNQIKRVTNSITLKRFYRAYDQRGLSLGHRPTRMLAEPLLSLPGINTGRLVIAIKFTN